MKKILLILGLFLTSCTTTFYVGNGGTHTNSNNNSNLELKASGKSQNVTEKQDTVRWNYDIKMK